MIQQGHLSTVMDLFASEQLNGAFWTLAKQGAFMCFLVACALLGASLMLWQPVEMGSAQTAYQDRTTVPARAARP